MMNDNTLIDTQYYIGPERRHANKPRRSGEERRYRYREESQLGDCRSGIPRRKEDEEGFFEIEKMYLGADD